MLKNVFMLLVLAFISCNLVFAQADDPGDYSETFPPDADSDNQSKDMPIQEPQMDANASSDVNESAYTDPISFQYSNLSVEDDNVSLEANISSINLTVQAITGSSYDYYIVAFDGPITEQQRAKVEHSGLEIVGYAGEYSYTARIARGASPEAKGFTLEKMESNPVTRVAMGESAMLWNITVVLYEGEDADGMAEAISAIAPAQVYDEQVITIDSATSDQLAQIRAMPGVMMAEERKPLELFNDYAAPVLGVSDVWSRLGLNGSNTIVAVADTGLDTGSISTVHLDFRGRVVGISAWCDGVKLPGVCSGNPTGMDLHGHGTHVAGSVLGNGTMSSGLIKGTAPGARLFMQSLNPNGAPSIYTPTDLRLLFDEAMDAGAKLHSNSWGAQSSHYYSSHAYYTDDFSRSNKDFLILFAAGNTGSSPYTVASQGHAKNALVIGSVETTRYGGDPTAVSWFSSRGPTSDGRYKPDLMAPGEDIVSTLASGVGSDPCGFGAYNSYYSFCSGTSMATPLSTGSATLVRDYLITNRSVAAPQSALIKAVLVAGADDLPAYGASPNFNSGFGRINLSNSLPEGSKIMNFTLGNASTGNTFSYTYHFLDSQNTRFALVWTDSPCTSSCDSKALVNDLDLKVMLPNGTVFYGNSRGSSSAGADRLNNVEIVQLTPVPGTYVVNVTGYNVPMGPQEFALVVLGGIDSDVPIVAISSPSNSTYGITTVPLTFQANDEDLDSCWYRLNGAGPTPLTGCNNLSSIPDVTEGGNSIVVYANDSGGNVKNASVSFTIDTIAPVITIVSPANNTLYTTSSIRVNISVTELHPSRTWFFNGTANETYTSSVLRTYADGNYNLTVWANDTAGHLSTAVANFSVDGTPPRISFVPPTFNSSSSLLIDYIQVNVSATDANLANITIRLYNSSKALIRSVNTTTDATLFANFTGLADGTYYFNATAYDTLGRANSTATWNVTLDTQAPIITINSPANGLTYNSTSVKVNISVTEAHPSKTWYFNGTTNTTYTGVVTKTFSQGPHTITVWANDTAGHLSTVTSDFTIDTVAPTIVFVPPTFNSSSSLLINYIQVNVSAADTNLANITIRLYNSSKALIRSVNTTTNATLFANFTGLPDGTYYFNATAYDAAKRSNSTATWNVTLDTQAPIIAINSPANGFMYNSTSVKVNISVTEAHPSKTWYFNGTTNTTYTGVTTKTFSQGPHSITVWSNDTAGHLSTATSDFTIDTVAPTISFVPPTFNSSLSLLIDYIPVNVSAADTNLANITINLYNSSKKLIRSVNTTTDTTLFANFTGLADGTYYFNATAYDLARSAKSTATWNVTLDTQAPVINILSPANGLMYNSTSVKVNLSVTEAHPSKTWYFNGTTNITYTGVTTKTFSQGPHSITVWANDTAGHISTASSDFTVDLPPVVTLNSPSTWARLSGPTLTFNFTAVDNRSATLNCSLYLDNVLNQSNESTLNNTLTTFIAGGIADGSHDWKVKCTDEANNVVTTSSRRFTVST